MGANPSPEGGTMESEIITGEMPREPLEKPLSRRDVILTGFAAAAGVAAAAMGAPSIAAANDGASVTVGSTQDASSTNFTAVQNGADLWGGLCGTGLGGPMGVSGYSAGGTGVRGNSDSGVAVYGMSGVGTQNWAGIGVIGHTVDAAGTGVIAINSGDGGGTALSVQGKTKMSRSGVGTIKKGVNAVTVPVSDGVTSKSMFLVTMQSDPGAGVYIRYVAKYSATKFRVVFNMKATKTATFAWMVLDQP